MIAAGIALVAFSLLLFVPSRVQLIARVLGYGVRAGRAEAAAEVAHARADRAEVFAQEALDDLFRVTTDRDYWRSTYHNSVGRLIAEVHAEQETPLFDAMCFETWEQEL